MSDDSEIDRVISELRPSLLCQVSGERLTYDREKDRDQSKGPKQREDLDAGKVHPACKVRAWWWRNVHHPGIRAEIQQDWTTVHHYADRALAYEQAKLPAHPASDPEVVTIALILTYLDAAAVEGNLARAWLYVNSADTFLPLVVPEEDLACCDLRLGIWDKSLRPDLQAVLNNSGVMTRVKILKSIQTGKTSPNPAALMRQILHEAPSELVGGIPTEPLSSFLTKLSETPQPSTGVGSAQAKEPSTDPEADRSSPPPGATPPREPSPLRKELQKAAQVRAECWNEQNQQIRFMGYLWGLAGVGLFVTLCIAIGIAEWIVRGHSPVSGITYPFLAAALLGLFGGALSAYMKATNVVIAISQYGLIVIYTLLRMLIGAAGAFVVIVSCLALPLGGLSSTVATNNVVFVLVAIAAGFSERLFVDALDQVAKNLGTVSKSGESMTTGATGS